MTRPSSSQPPGRTDAPWRRFGIAELVELVLLLAILTLAAYLRFARLAETPGWYSDEGTVADIAQHLARGETQYLAINRSTLLAARLPLMPWLLSKMLGGPQTTLLILRKLTAALGVLSTLLLYALVRYSLGMINRWSALLSAALFAVYPVAVFYSRIGFSYNLLAPLVILAAAGFWQYLDRGRRGGLALAAIVIGIGTLTDLMMISLVGPFLLVALSRRKGDLLWGLPLLATPFGLYAVSMLLADPAAFAFDLKFIITRLGAVEWWAQIPLVAYNLGTLAISDPWWLPATIGLLLLRPPRWRALLLTMLFVPLALLGRSSGIAGLRRYSISPLSPFIALGVANLLAIGLPWILRWGQETLAHAFSRVSWLGHTSTARWLRDRLIALGTAAAAFGLALTPVLISTFSLFAQVRGDFRPENDWAYLPPEVAAAAAATVNRLAEPSELVLASPALAWALKMPAADFQQALAFAGQPSIDFPANVPRDRFAFVASFDQASFVVVDRIWREWGAVHLDSVADMLEQIKGWPIVWEREGIAIHVRERP